LACQFRRSSVEISIKEKGSAMAESEEEFDTWDDDLTVVTETPSEETSTAPKQRLPHREVSYSPTGAGFPDGLGTQ